ncbi:MAG: hypothetical protein WDO24_20715 [Pseudomonadota bacterium]
MMRLALTAVGLLALGLAACTTPNVVPPFANTDEYKSAAQAAQSDTSFIPPTDPRYSENGAPRAGEPTGVSVAGDPALIGDGKTYAPISHRHLRGM